MDAEKASDLDPHILDIIRSERQKGFMKGLNMALAILALVCVAYVALHVSVMVPGCREAYSQAEVQMSIVTMIVLNHHGQIVFFLVLANLVSLGAAMAWGDRGAVAIPTIACFFLTMLWLAMCTTGLFLPLLRLLEEIGKHR